MPDVEDKYGPEHQANVEVTRLFRLDGRVALVTGGAGLYGSVISTALAEAGAAVIIASRNLERCEARAASLRDQGYRALAMSLDLAQDDSIRALCQRIVAECGRIDILFNNAAGRADGGAKQQTQPGRKGYNTSLPDMSRDWWEGTMAINASGHFVCTQVFAEQMKAQRRGGSIINIASIYGLVGPDFSIYAGTQMTSPPDYAFAKGGIISLTRYLATYYAPSGIRVNALSLGGYYTDQPAEYVHAYEARTPLARMARWNDLKGPAVFLASDASQYVTGQTLAVEGGWTAW
jgi:NAD(P)-dependent dehydrogenase (short-subunit alcohol dehydrogenase family)